MELKRPFDLRFGHRRGAFLFVALPLGVKDIECGTLLRGADQKVAFFGVGNNFTPMRKAVP
jgi:hypothetical protein